MSDTRAIVLYDPLNACERQIHSGRGKLIEGYREIGEALTRISMERLYKRAGYKSFKAYCLHVWGYSRGRAYQLISAEAIALIAVNAGLPPPENERVARALEGETFTPEQKRVLWTLAQKTAPDGKVTARHVNALVEVAKQAMTTGAIDPGNGESVLIAEAFEAAVIGEEYEALLRQRQYIADSQKGQRVYSGRAEVVGQTGACITLKLEGTRPEVWTGDNVRVTIYTTE